MTTQSVEVESQGIIEIRDPEVDVSAIMAQIRANMATRTELSPLPASLAGSAMQNERREVMKALEALQHKIRRYGTVETHRGGWKGKADLFIKKVVRKLIKRHLIQQEEVHEALLATMDKLAHHLDQRDQLTMVHLNRLEEKLGKIDQDLSGQSLRWVERGELEVFATDLLRVARESPPAQASLYDASSQAFDYFGFEQKYRGAFEVIKKRLSIYLPYFTHESLVLDIGCGRGEFVELLKEQGIPVRGIDLSPEGVAYAKERGLPVDKADAFEVLTTLPDNSLGGVFLGQVIEHLEPSRMLSLLSLCRKKLKPGAYVVAETPNPQCLMVFAESFYMDLSHLRPVHPLTLEFILQGIGFQDVKLMYSSPADDLRLPALAGEGIENLAAFNEGVDRLNGILFSHRDYAGIGRK